jgi:YfiH family protein
MKTDRMGDVFGKDARQLYQVGLWRGYSWLDHGFGTRDSDGLGESIATLKQVHSDTIVKVEDGLGCLGNGDALITDRPGVYVTIRTADCIPVLIVDPVRRAVGAVHAGWRGTAASIVAKTVARMRSEFGSEAGDLEAAIGPGIGQCCYEVGPDVAARFAQWFPELNGVESAVRIDLVEANRRQLAGAGVRQVLVASRCTRCGSDEFHSFRRDGDLSGRMTSGIGIVSERTGSAL